MESHGRRGGLVALLQHCRHAGIQTSRLAALSHAGTGSDHSAITDHQGIVRRAIDDVGACSDVDALSDVDVAADMHAGRERGEVSNSRIMANRAVEIDVDVLTDLDVDGQNGSGTDDRPGFDIDTIRHLGRWILEDGKFAILALRRKPLSGLWITNRDQQKIVGIRAAKQINRQYGQSAQWVTAGVIREPDKVMELRSGY